MDYTKEPPEIKPGFVRDERVQADHIIRMLKIFAAEGFGAAHVYTYINTGAPHVRQRRLDLDIASFSLVKTIAEHYSDPYARYRTQPKQSFTALADYNC